MDKIFGHIERGDINDPLRFFRGIALEHDLLWAISMFLPSEQNINREFRNIDYDNLTYEVNLNFNDENPTVKEDWEEHKFQNALWVSLHSEKNKFKQFLTENIYKNISDVTSLLTFIIYDFKKLIVEIDSSQSHKNHPIIKEIINGLIVYIESEYADYFPDSKKVSNGTNKSNFNFLKGKSISEEALDTLYLKLCHQDFKLRTSRIVFRKTLLNIVQNKPLQEIVNIELTNQETIYFLLARLNDCKYIDFKKLELSKKLLINNKKFTKAKKNSSYVSKCPDNWKSIILAWLHSI